VVEVIETVDAEKLAIGLSLKLVSPVPSGAMVIFSFAPSVIVIVPVSEFPVLSVTLLLPLDLKYL